VAVRRGGCGASEAVGQCGMAGSSPAAVLTGGARVGGTQPAPKQGRPGADWWAPVTVPGNGGLNTF
jgi:hypothetical protein